MILTANQQRGQQDAKENQEIQIWGLRGLLNDFASDDGFHFPDV